MGAKSRRLFAIQFFQMVLKSAKLFQMSYISDFFPKIKNYKYCLATVGSTPQLCLDAGALEVNSVRSTYWCKFSLLDQIQYCIEVMHEFSTKVVLSTLFALSHIKLKVKSYSVELEVRR